ncbi:MAG: hypothetical protein FWG18_03020 [Alphaproteobacteria bacterium]|nr:hypothetical protein [Alphaproteobacteria bacterium]
MRCYKVLIFATVISACLPVLAADEPPVVTSTNYVDTGLALKANISSLKPVAFSGSYNDLIDKPNPNDSFAALYEVRSNSISNAATNDDFWIDMDNLRFRAYKASTTNYWGLRIVNNTGAAINYASRGQHIYSGMQINNKEGTFASGTEFNPDTEANDVGYSRGDVFITHFFDTTNMHLYRWTVHVNVSNAIMSVEKLH